MLTETTQRPWPLPSGRWVLKQNWHDVLFAHWSLSPDEIRPFVPPQLPLDTLNGRAWVGLVPFRMTGIRLRGMPALPWVSSFPEMNLRTYVRLGDRSGVHFLSLDGDSRLGVAVARRWFRVPYYRAKMRLYRQGETIHFWSRRQHKGAPSAVFKGSYAPTGDPFRPGPGTLEHWLVERYCLFSVDPRGRILLGEIHHPPWELRKARMQASENTVGAGVGLDLNRPPEHLAYSGDQQAVFWPPRPVSGHPRSSS